MLFTFSRTAARAAVAAMALTLATTAFGSAGAVASQPSMHVTIAVNGKAAGATSDARPAELYPSRPIDIRLDVHNLGDATLFVSSVRFQGQVLDLPLFSYDSTLDLAVRPHAISSLTLPISTSGIGSLATGLIVASVTLVGPGGTTLFSQSVVTDVHGSLLSVYGLFGLVVLILTASSLSFASIAMARHRLPENRWLRAVRFLIPGFGIGLVLTFTTAAFGMFSPGTGHWPYLLFVPTAVGLAVGFLTPAPNEEEFDDYDENVLLAQIVVVDDDSPDGSPDQLDGSPPSIDGSAGGKVEGRITTGSLSQVPDSRATVLP